jgi:hypothetical protein
VIGEKRTYPTMRAFAAAMTTQGTQRPKFEDFGSAIGKSA